LPKVQKSILDFWTFGTNFKGRLKNLYAAATVCLAKFLSDLICAGAQGDNTNRTMEAVSRRRQLFGLQGKNIINP
jgi:hypothetical protein